MEQEVDRDAGTMSAPEVPTEISTSGDVNHGQRTAVEAMVERIVDSIDDQVLHVRIRIEHHPGQDRVHEVSVRVVLEIRGGSVRAHVDTGSIHEAIEALDRRLRSQLRQRSERRLSAQHRGATSPEGEWRHGDLATERPPYFPRPVDERRIVRHKSFSPGTSDVDEAVFDLEQMSYDFYLFVESGGNEDALVARRDEGGYSVRSISGSVNGTRDHGFELVVDGHPAAELSLAMAQERLDAGHEPFVFFRDRESGRGHVLYRRYDGHYGLIVPLDED